MGSSTGLTRKQFLQTTGAALGGTLLSGPAAAASDKEPDRQQMRVALVGTGVRGVAMYGRNLIEGYSDYVEMVGVCDINPGRLEYGHEYIGADCPAFTDLAEMLQETEPEWLIVTTWDWEHHNSILTGLEHDCNIICEKPLTIDEEKAQMILDAEQRYGKEIIVTFNYRYAPHRAKVKELLMDGAIGEVTSVDLNWNISHGHLQQYMQRWHGERERGGTLWVHKATHHFDLVNWWLDSDPVEVRAAGDLEHFGPQGPFRSESCRDCPHAEECDYYWDITENEHLTSLYVENEDHDGYIRDGCVFRENIDIYDKHSAVVRYANNAYLNYSLTGESDFEGFWLAFNGTEGRLEMREGGWPPADYEQITLMRRGETPRVLAVPHEEGGHWGGDPVLMDKLFKDPDMPDPLHQAAGTRDGVMSILVGIAARKSTESGQPVQIADLTDLEPQAQRPRG